MIPFSVSFAFGMAALVAAAVRWARRRERDRRWIDEWGGVTDHERLMTALGREAQGKAATTELYRRWLFEDGCRDAYRSALEAEAGWREEAGGPRAVPGAER